MAVVVIPIVRIFVSVVVGGVLAGLATWWLAPRFGVPEARAVTPAGAAFAGGVFVVLAVASATAIGPLTHELVPDRALLVSYLLAATALAGGTGTVGWSASSADESREQFRRWIGLLLVAAVVLVPAAVVAVGLVVFSVW